MSEGVHAKWRVRQTLMPSPNPLEMLGQLGWIVDEWNYEESKWASISIRFNSEREAIFYLHCNALVECAVDNEDWKLL